VEIGQISTTWRIAIAVTDAWDTDKKNSVGVIQMKGNSISSSGWLVLNPHGPYTNVDKDGNSVTGSVGIGIKTPPKASLHVGGTLYATGATTLDSTLKVIGATTLSSTLTASSSIYAPTFVENGTALSSKYLGISANAASASKVTNNLTLQYNGTSAWTFNGDTARTLNIKPGSNVSVSGDSSGNITIAATNTTYSASTGLTLSSGAFSLNTASTSTIGGIKVASTSYNPTLTASSTTTKCYPV
jgi:hypothetical protein